MTVDTARPLGSRNSRLVVAALDSPATGLVISLLAAGLWLESLSVVDPGRISDLGLVSVLPIRTFVALGLHVIGFMLVLYRARPSPAVVWVQLITWIVMLHGFNPLVAAEPVFEVAWRHAGITDYILTSQSVDPTRDAYFNWPGFFSLSALVTGVAGLSDPVALIRWAPPFFNLMYLAPLAVLFRSATSNRKTVWLALWLFYTANWISQDYLSPQAFAYFGYLLIIALLLTWFVPQRFGEAALVDPISPSPPQRVTAMAVVIGVFAAIVPSHQLTPFAVLIGVALLVMTRRLSLPTLPVLMGVLLAGWIGYMTINYLAGHFFSAFNPVGLTESANLNVQGRLQGTPEHMLVVRSRLVTTALLWGLAALGIMKTRRRFPNWSALVTLLAMPLPLMVLQPYGGEMLMRANLLILPLCAIFTAGLLTPRFETSSSAGVTKLIVASLLGLIMVGGFLLSRYGNQTIDMFTTEETEAVAHLYRIAPAGSYLLAAEPNLPWQYKHYGDYRYDTLRDHRLDFSTPLSLEHSLLDLMRDQPTPESFIILTRGQREAVALLGMPAPTSEAPPPRRYRGGWLDDLAATLEESDNFELVFSNADAKIYQTN